MTWITDNKGQGPWSFTAQPDKWGYLNNPRWTNKLSVVEFATARGLPIDPTNKHTPCGHWHKSPDLSYNTLYGAGNSDSGQLGKTSGQYTVFFNLGAGNNWKMVACGSTTSLAVKLDGTMWATGYNLTGQLGLGNYTMAYAFTQVGTGNTWDWVSGGRYHSVAIKTDGTIWATGNNNEGQLGIPSITVSTNVFTQIGTDSDWSMIDAGPGSWHTAAIKSNGTLWTCGKNESGQLGLGDAISRDEFTQVGTDTNWIKVSVGEAHTLALKNDGTLWGTGRNTKGQLGLGDAISRDEFTQIGTSTTWIDCIAGEYFSYAQKAGGAVFATGDNDDGQLGQGDNVELHVFTQVGTSSWDFVNCGQSGAHVLFIDDDTDLATLGRNDYGQLGLMDFVDRTSLSNPNLTGVLDAAGGFQHSIVIKTLNAPANHPDDPVWPM